LFDFGPSQQLDGPEMINYALPHSDENAPDLYLPVMSLITYCLLCALCYGTSGQFNPEVIANVTSKCFFTQAFEVTAFRLCLQFALQSPIPILDLVAYTGYKYLGLTVNMLFGIFFGFIENWGKTGFYLTFLWTASAAAFFMLKIMSNNIPLNESTGPTREMIVIGFAVSQAAIMWFVSQTTVL
jgi:protein transport protein YIF1